MVLQDTWSRHGHERHDIARDLPGRDGMAAI
jgi:hypothetical protein